MNRRTRVFCARQSGGFYSWSEAEEGQAAELRIDGTIDTGESWFDDTTTPRAFREALDAHDGQPIIVTISSPGGDLFAGFDIYDMLKTRRGQTTIRIPALCASAASIIAMAASPGELVMARTGMLMLHNPLVMAGGNAAELREQAGVLDELTDIMVGIYMDRYTGTEAELRALLDAESYIAAPQALACGLCDRVEAADERQTGAQARVAACTREALAHIPQGLRRLAGKTQPTPEDRRRALIEAQRQYHEIMTDR